MIQKKRGELEDNSCIWYVKHFNEQIIYGETNKIIFFYFNQISEKNEQIEKLIKRVTLLQRVNNQFASEHEKLQKEIQALEKQIDQHNVEQKKGCESCQSHMKQIDENHSDIDELKHQNERLLKQNAHQTDDINMMKILIYRLNVQLENYQQLIRKSNLGDKYESSYRNEASILYDNIESIEWGCVRSNVLAPLLNAYQETIKEKINLIKQYDTELNQTTGRLKDILAENEQLYIDVEQSKRKTETWITERIRLQAQSDVCR